MDGSSSCTSQDLSGAVDSSHDVEEAGRVLTSSVKFDPILQIPLIRVTLPITGTSFPVLDLAGPVDISQCLVFGNRTADGVAGHEVEGVIPEEVVPKDEGRRDGGTSEIVVPFVKESHDLIALLADVFIGEEQELGFPVDVDETVFSLLDQWVRLDASNEIEETAHCELVSCGG